MRVNDKEKTHTNPHQPAPWVQDSGRWENSNPYPYPWQPVPMTHIGWPTCDFPYVLKVEGKGSDYEGKKDETMMSECGKVV
jgi:hypothetical protein